MTLPGFYSVIARHHHESPVPGDWAALSTITNSENLGTPCQSLCGKGCRREYGDRGLKKPNHQGAWTSEKPLPKDSCGDPEPGAMDCFSSEAPYLPCMVCYWVELRAVSWSGRLLHSHSLPSPTRWRTSGWDMKQIQISSALSLQARCQCSVGSAALQCTLG